MKNTKLTYVKTEVTVIDESTNNNYKVTMSGKNGHITCTVFKNANRVYTGIRSSGHANQSMAIATIKAYLQTLK